MMMTFTHYFKLVLAYISYYFEILYDHYCDYPYEVQIAICAIIGVLVLISSIIIGMLYKWRASSKEQRRRQALQRRFSSVINHVLYGPINEDAPLTRDDIINMVGKEVQPGQKSLLTHKKDKCQFCRIIYDRFIVDTPDDQHIANLHILLDLCDIPSFLEEQVSLGSMGCKVKAITMMRTFKLYISPWLINKLLNSKNTRVKRLAMYSLIMSSSDTDFEYFETDFFDSNSCIYDEIELGYALHRRLNIGLPLPNLAQWAHLQKDNQTRCVFVRLMRRFDQREYCSELVDLYQTCRHKKLIEEISRTWGYLHYVDGEPLMTGTIPTQPDDTKVAILHAITRIASGKSLPLLLDEYQNLSNPHVRFEALRCIYNYGQEGRELFDRLERKAPETDRHFFDFFHNSITLFRIPLDKEQAYHPSVETVHGL